MKATKTLVCSLVLSRLDYCSALLAGSPQVLLDKIQRVINCSASLIYKLQNLSISLLYFLISTGCQSAAEFNTKQLSPVSTLSLVQLLHTALSCFVSILLLVLFVQPQILGFSVYQGCISDLSSGTLFLSLSGMPRQSPLWSQN